jgi:hypothetical protein
MPLCPQVTITPITVTTSGMTTTSVIAANAPATTEQANELQTEINTIEAAVNGKNHIYRQASAPDGSVYALVEGDVWFDTDDGNKQYYWTGTAWVSVQDTAIAAATTAANAATIAAAEAETAANAAQTTADGKNKIYRQGTTPTGTFSVGDLWFDTANDNRIARWDGSSWVQYGLGNAAIANLDAGKITTGFLAAARIEAASIAGTKIAAGTIQAVNIEAGTITGAKIAAETITAGNIATATITADQIAGATITAAEIAAETITAAEIAADSITVDRLTAGTLTAFTLRTSSGARRVTISAANNAISFTESSSVVGWVGPASTSGVVMHYGSTFNANVTTYPNAYVSSGDARIAYSSGIYVQVASGGVTMNGDVYTLDSFYNQDSVTTTNTANTWMSGTSGLTRRSTASSQRYKENIVDIRTVPALDPNKLLSLPVRAFTYKADYLDSADDRSGTPLPGFIAEEVAETYEIAADKNDGVIESWNDRFVVPGILALVQDLHARVATLEGGTQ